MELALPVRSGPGRECLSIREWPTLVLSLGYDGLLDSQFWDGISNEEGNYWGSGQGRVYLGNTGIPLSIIFCYSMAPPTT